MAPRKRSTEIKEIESVPAKNACFTKRRKGLFRKAQQYHQLSRSHIVVLVFSPTGRPHIHGSPSFNPTVDRFLQNLMEMAVATNPNYSVSDDGTTTNACGHSDMGLRERVEGIKIGESESLEELLEMKKKLEEIRESVVHDFVDSLILGGGFQS